MQEELFVIRDLHNIDAEIDAARARLAEMVGRVRQTTAEVSEAKAALAEIEAAVAAVQEEERTLNRRMEEYILRRDRTRGLIDAGKVSDFITASRQLDQCEQIVDELETEVLDRMERREELEGKSAAAGARLAAGRAADTEARQPYHQEAPTLKSRIETLTAQRVPLLGRLNPDYRRQYSDLRGRGKLALCNITDAACSACHETPPPQVIIEVGAGTRIHSCRGCQRFFFDVSERGDHEAEVG